MIIPNFQQSAALYIKDVNWEWLIRLIYINGASFYFLLIYIHIRRNLFYYSFKLNYVWLIGVLILFLSIATAFLGYVLPWGQISFWGAIVITNLLSALPYIGQIIVERVWGGFSINNSTLNRRFSFHFTINYCNYSIFIFNSFTYYWINRSYTFKK